MNTKRQIREKMKSMRMAIPAAMRTAFSEAICQKALALPEIMQARTVMLYHPIRSEVDVQSMYRPLWEQGKTILLPAMDGKVIVPVLFQPHQAMRYNAFGVLEPLMWRTYQGTIDVCIVPGVAFDMQGMRQGYGAGCYDRFLPKHTCFCIGFAYDCQVLETIPSAAHDVRMDCIVTQEKILRIHAKK